MLEVNLDITIIRFHILQLHLTLLLNYKCKKDHQLYWTKLTRIYNVYYGCTIIKTLAISL